MIYVVNKSNADVSGHNCIYVGRPSIFGNPFPLMREIDREMVLKKYEIWFKKNLLKRKFKKALKNLEETAKNGDLYLVCWCHPKRCHADIIKRYLDNKIKHRR